MKIALHFFISVFVLFLITPTFVCIIKKSTDTSSFYNISEEEQFQKEIKAVFVTADSEIPLSIVYQKSMTFSNKNVGKHDSIASIIFIPPPEFA